MILNIPRKTRHRPIFLLRMLIEHNTYRLIQSITESLLSHLAVAAPDERSKAPSRVNIVVQGQRVTVVAGHYRWRGRGIHVG